MQDLEKAIGMSDYNGTPLLVKHVVSGSFIKKRYIKCPHTDKRCEWRMSDKHRSGYEYLDGACYLSGSFDLKCPE